MEIKYTTDGKKVIVIGSLNSQEKIVQEIFIVDGGEIPSGEHFVVKSLHDAPAVSWKEKNLKELEEKYEKLKFEYDNNIKVLNNKLRNESSVLKLKLQSLTKLSENIKPESFNRILDFMSGNITHVVIDSYSGVEIKEFNKAIEQTEDYDSSKIKLCTLYGVSDGNIEYYINSYSDGSGHGKVQIKPFCSYEEAFDYAKELIINKFDKYPSISLIKNSSSLNFDLDSEKVKQFYITQNNEIEKRIVEKLKEIEEYKSKIVFHYE